MEYGKFRSLQQQIDDEALRILRYKFPRNFVFREQDKDFGIDCEFEQFKPKGLDEKMQVSTAVIFKAQVKGVEDGAELELKTEPVLSKAFRISDIDYWYEQMKIPVVIFLIDIKTETIYWTGFYSNKELRDDYLAARHKQHQTVNIRFDKNQTIPKRIEDLLKAVDDAQQWIALSILPKSNILEQYIKECPNLDLVIRASEEKLELAHYYRFKKYIDENNLVQAESQAFRILQNSEFSPTLKLYTIIFAGQVIFANKAIKSEVIDPYAYILNWQTSTLRKFVCIAPDVPVLVTKIAKLLEQILGIRIISNKIFDLQLTAKVSVSNEENLISILSVPYFHAREAQLFNTLGKTVEEYNKEIQDCPVEDLLRVTGISSPRFIQAINPIKRTYLIAQDHNKLQELERYELGIVRFHAIICERLLDEAMMTECLISAISISNSSEAALDFQLATEIVGNIQNAEFRNKAKKILKGLVEDFSRSYLSRPKQSEMQAWKDMAIFLAKQYGYDLSKDVSELGYKTELDISIHNMLKHGLEELDLTEYLNDCQYRHIYKPEFAGVSDVADAIGLGFATSMKGVACLKKQVISNSVGRYVKDTHSKFYSQYCLDCSLIEPHEEDWEYSYDWQITQDNEFNEMVQKYRGN